MIYQDIIHSKMGFRYPREEDKLLKINFTNLKYI